MTKRRPPKSVRYCSRELFRSPAHYALCLDAEGFEAELQRLHVPPAQRPVFVRPGSDACVHYMQNSECGNVAIVCLRVPDGVTPVEVAALLVHEAVHVWQWIKELVGEDAPSVEFEAYSIQSISQNLMEAYARTLQP